MQERIGLQGEHQEGPTLLDVQPVHMTHRMLGLALRRPEAGEIVFAQQRVRGGLHGRHIQRLKAPARPARP
ncbi:hypothetical protein G6F55_014229 [Rhizopus delemar]|nr:hypothetical protein G6F68_020899 [Rhizopus microsporus]KAG1436333.1 hypothetical protein G6F55_014229 [Rhizopus delemar]